MADDAAKKGDEAKVDRVHARRRDHSPTGSSQIEREVEDLKTLHLQSAQAVRAGQGGRRSRTRPRAEEADRAQQAPRPARPGQDAGADEQGDGPLSETVGQDVPPSTRSGTRSRPATPRPRAWPSSPRPRSRAACSRSSRPPQHRGPRPPGRDAGSWASAAGDQPRSPRAVEAPAASSRCGTALPADLGARAWQDTTRSSAVDDLVRALPSGRSAVRSAGDLRLSAAAVHPVTRPLAKTTAVRPGDLDRVVGVEACPRPDDAGRQQRAVAARPAPGGRPRRPRPRPTTPTGEGDPELAAASRLSRGSTTVPTPPRPRRPRRRSTPGRSAAAITARTPDHAAILAAATFDAMPPLPRSSPPRRRAASSCWSISTISSISDAAVVEAGVGGEQPGVSVSSTSRSAPTRWATSAARRSLSPKRISSSAMASFSLMTGTTPSSSRRCERPPGVQVLRRIDEVERREQHLAGDQAVGGEDVVVDGASAGSGRPRTAPGGSAVRRPPLAPSPSAGEPGGDGAATSRRRPRGRRRGARATSSHKLRDRLDVDRTRRSVIDDVPILATTITAPSVVVGLVRRRLNRADVDGVARPGPGPGQRPVDTEPPQAAVGVREGLDVRRGPTAPPPARLPARSPERAVARPARPARPRRHGRWTTNAVVRASARPARLAHQRRPSRRRARATPSPVTAETRRPSTTSASGRRRRPRTRRPPAAVRADRAGSGRARRAAPAPARPAPAVRPARGRRARTSTRARSTWRRNRWPRPLPFARALDEPGDVGDDELGVVAEPHHAEVGLERGERVVGDLGLGRRDAGDQRALADVREADERDVGHQLQLEPQPALLAVLALLGERRRPPPVATGSGRCPGLLGRRRRRASGHRGARGRRAPCRRPSPGRRCPAEPQR